MMMEKLKLIINLKELFDNIGEHIGHISAETLSWIAVVLIHMATVPTLIAILTGLTEKMPPVDLVLFIWAGLSLFFIRAAILKDMVMVITIGFGFPIQATLMGLIIFK